MQYHSPHQTQAIKREFDVYAVVHRWGWWYAIGYCHHRQAVRTFRVDRIQSLIVLQESFETPPDFDIHVYLEQEMANRPWLMVTLRFSAEVAAVAREYALGLGNCRRAARRRANCNHENPRRELGSQHRVVIWTRGDRARSRRSPPHCASLGADDR